MNDFVLVNVILRTKGVLGCFRMNQSLLKLLHMIVPLFC